MNLEWLAFRGSPQLELIAPVTGYAVAVIYAALLGLFVARRRDEFQRFGIAHWLGLGLSMALGFLLSRTLIVSVSGGSRALTFAFYPLAFFPLLAAALWLGQISTALVGFAVGLGWMLFGGGRITQPLEMAALGAVVGTLLRQNYRGMANELLRQPLIATLLGILVVAWPSTLISVLATGQGSPLASLERTLGMVTPTLLTYLATALLPAVAAQLAVARWPALHPVPRRTLRPAPWKERLSLRMLSTFVPLAVLAVALLVGVVAGTAYQVATRLVVDQMARDSAIASSQMPFFIQMGRSLIRKVVADHALVGVSPPEAAASLEDSLRAVPYFEQLLYLGPDGGLVASYPPAAGSGALYPEEEMRIRTALDEGVPAEVTLGVARGRSAMLSFIAPVTGPDDTPAGVVIGRTALDTNPLMAPVVGALQGGFAGSGEGYLIDSQNRILLYPAAPGRQQTTADFQHMAELPVSSGGQAFSQRLPDETRQLVYLLSIEGHSEWSLVMAVPSSVVLALALQIALPPLLLLVLMLAVAFPLTLTLMRDITFPLEKLAQAADEMAEGNLSVSPDVGGPDEIGRLGRAFEELGARMQKRLAELQRLLNVSRTVSSSLELFRAMPPILNSAIDATQAVGARVVLFDEETDAPLRAYMAGEAAAAMAVLDRDLLELVERQGTVVIRQIWRAVGSLNTAKLLPSIRSVVALPLRGERAFLGALWLAYDHEHDFDQSEMTFLTTLAGQAAVAVANARLLAEADEGRRKLEAVLESTADGVIVVDNEGRIVLMNPAAEAYFGIRLEQTGPTRVADVIDVPELARAMTDLQEPVSVLELPLGDNRTLLANASTIVTEDGAIDGRVALLRDVTPLKELDNIKTVFLRMVSHDLRSPLTYMRGYVTMLPLEGPLNERQSDALERINTGIDHISQLTERLTYLSRLQFGREVELETALLDIAVLLRDAAHQQERFAQQKGILIDVEADDDLPLLLADRMLITQAVSNLIHNAIKYTMEGGHVMARAALEGGSITIAVEDDGVGIRPDDQAHLFEAFYRVPQREGDPPRPKGSGLGLALVKAIVDAHGGQVGVYSVHGHGSVFSMSLPITQPVTAK